MSVFNAVMNHLDVVSRPVGSHVAAARLVLSDGRNFRINWREGAPPFLGASGIIEGPFRAPSSPYSDTEKWMRFSLRAFSRRCVSLQSEFPDDDILRLEEWHKLVDPHSVHGAPALTMIWAFRGRASDREFFERLGRNDILVLGAPGGKLLGHGSGAIKDADSEAPAFQVENEILT